MMERLSLFGQLCGDMKKAANVHAVLGSRNIASSPREKNDFYATSPEAIPPLLERVQFQHNILEPCCGQGHLAEALKSYGHDVEASDLIDRGYGIIRDFFAIKETAKDIVTNPPYFGLVDYMRHGVDLLQHENQKMAMFLRILTLESQERKAFFDSHPPILILVSSSRIACAKNGEFEKYKSTAQAYAWFVWKAGHNGETILKWF